MPFGAVNGDDEAAILRSALNEELGFYPASTDPESVERYRRDGAKADAGHAQYLREYGPNGYKRDRWRHLAEQQRQDAVEVMGRAAVSDLHE